MKSVEIRDETQKEHNKFQQLSHANAGVSGGYFLFNVMHRRFVQVDANVIQQQQQHTQDDDVDDDANACSTHIHTHTH